MFSDIKAKETVKCDWGRRSTKVVVKGNKIHRKTHIKVLHFLLICPFYKAEGQEINVVSCQVENAVNGYLLLITLTKLPNSWKKCNIPISKETNE